MPISRFELWPVTEERANMIQMFSAASVAAVLIQTVTENIRFDEKSVFINKLVFMSFATFNLQDWVIENLT